MTLQKKTVAIRMTWAHGLLIICYFILLSILASFSPLELLFRILAWPYYILPHTFLAAIVQLLFAYAIATTILTLKDIKGMKQTAQRKQ